MLLPIADDAKATSNNLIAMSQKAISGVQFLSQITEDELKIGASEKVVVYENDHIKLYHYTPLVENPLAVPVLIVYALVNRPYMVDLEEKRSLVKQLLQRGVDIYLIDWGYPTRNDRWLTLEDYIEDYIDSCVDFIRETHALTTVNLMGICQGGALSLCYAALHPEKVQNFISMAAPVDFHAEESLLTAWMRYGTANDEFNADTMVDALGNIPGDLMNFGFLMLKPFELGLQKYLTLLDTIEDKEYALNFLRMEKWIFDSPDQAGEAWRQYINDFYIQNKLYHNTFELAGKPVRLKSLTMPILNVFAEHDHLVPPQSSTALKHVTSSTDYTSASFPVGHVGMYVSSKVQQQLPLLIAEWLRARLPE